MLRKILVVLAGLLLCSNIVLASGTGAGTLINAISTNVQLNYDDGVNTFYSTAASFNIEDVTKSIGTINGFYESNVDISSLGSPTGGVYKNRVVGTDYNLSFAYLNRGNATDNMEISAALTQAASRWTVSNSSAITVNEDQIGTLYVTVNPTTAQNYERATLNITANIVDYLSKNVVSYNVMSAVVSSDMQGGAYGGLGLFTHTYVLEAEGVSLSMLSKTVSWNYPVGYTGTTTEPMPGSKITYTVVIKNNSTGVASGVKLVDKVPASCHLYYTDGVTTQPDVVGAAAWSWIGATDNTADSTTVAPINFSITISGNATVTASYSVSVD